MLTYSQITRHDNLPFEQYLEIALQGYLGSRYYSHSFLKREVAGQSPYQEVTAKMKLGSLVDEILTSPETVNVTDPNFKMACRIASTIKAKWGGLISQFVPQISYTGSLTYKGLALPVCGRLDWKLSTLSVIDLKVTDAKTDKEFAKIINHFGYDNQLFNYMGLSETKSGYIMPYSTKAEACLSVVKIERTLINGFWQDSVIKFGR